MGEFNRPSDNYDDLDTKDLIQRQEKLIDLFTPNSTHWHLLMELLEIERELTKRET